MRPRTIAAAGLVLAAAVLGAAALISSRPADSDYFGPNEPTWVRVPTTLGDAVYVGVGVLHARAGDTVELDSAIVEGLLGDAEVVAIARIIQEPANVLGAITESEVGETIGLASYGPVPNLKFSAGDGAVALALKVTGTSPVHGFDGIRVQFTINGAARIIEDRIPLRASICTGATPAESLERCRPIAAEMHDRRP